MATRDQISELARGNFLAARPRLATEITALTEDLACGASLDEYRAAHYQSALTAEAQRLNLHPWEYQLKIAEQAGLDVSAIREEDRRAEAKALGLNELM